MWWKFCYLGHLDTCTLLLVKVLGFLLDAHPCCPSLGPGGADALEVPRDVTCPMRLRTKYEMKVGRHFTKEEIAVANKYMKNA